MARKNQSLYLIVATVIMLMCFFSVKLTAQDMPRAGGEQLLNERCTKCHDLKRVEKEFGKYDRARWEKIVDGMIKRGATLNTEERVAVIDYLAAQPAAVKKQ